MKCLTVKQPYASQIASGKKQIEYRTWKTTYRGPLLIHASQPDGRILCLVDLVDIMGQPGKYEWHLRNPRPLEPPVRAKGRLMLWEYNGRLDLKGAHGT